uniref:CBF1-interacting co-repressor CIR N-terminal domain-containing protein n=1 Tax=Rhodosorus marinus TaxID=101924 RepID=A0A7S2ZV39_9RHOD|mmetsp:Transcript_32893/g.129156  ORF Transcript_32893/g.129156 Transcript_32893/m.129156 type:complete len:236 (+) Transcript_32893:1721-2428(+)|eukprot:CAMPEP_0113967256 /NCGR_PEP_ID=MMETSP0011_2-20120614/8818_1 /TAXON_ID=101924 /ORGANISM="Rhodosorus marinus" /LENGTH=235 /DNA_ID=CAMNT_0000980097 /DNA_START=440 /DNA_END=1147 /DNA_ORIENTATION=- /assembly_acc=CAM_ASM_000156
MNILPHKSWNVWSVKNIARVERDEERARLEESERKEKAWKVESEKRLERLRDKSKKFKNSCEEDERFSLFAEEERKAGSENPDVSKERRKREARELDSSRDYLGGKERRKRPWYAAEVPEGRLAANADSRKQLREDKRKQREDPLASNSSRTKKHTRKTHEKRKTPSKSQTTSIEELRQQREKREAAERKRIEAVLSNSNHSTQTPLPDDRSRDYHEGFTAYSGGRRRDKRRRRH